MFCRPRVAAGLLLVVGLSAPAGCVSFKAVGATGELGKGLSSHQDAIGYIEPMCRSVSVLTAPRGLAGRSQGADAVAARGVVASAPESPEAVAAALDTASDSLDCGALGDDAAAWRAVVAALVGYGDALVRLAGSDRVDLSAQLEGVRTGLVALDVEALGTDQAKAAVKAASAIVGLVVQEMRRKALRDAVLAADPHVQQLATQLAAHARQQLIVLDDLDNNLGNLAEDIALETADADDLRVLAVGTSMALDGWIEQRRAELRALVVATEAFAAAHRVLAQDAEKLGREDARTLGKIIVEVKAVYGAASSIATQNPERE